jgi:hypothetical protein
METLMGRYIEVIFDGPPGPRMRFVEVEDENGLCAEVGRWVNHGLNGYWGLRISAEDIVRWDPAAARPGKAAHAVAK